MTKLQGSKKHFCELRKIMLRTDRRGADYTTNKKLAVQWLNDPESLRDSALHQVQWRQVV